MRLHILAPGLLDFREVLGAADHDESGYQRFWEAVAERAPELLSGLSAAGPVEVEVARTRVRGRFNRYAQVDVDTLSRPVEAIVLRCTPAQLGTGLPPAFGVHHAEAAIECRVMDHGIFLLEVQIGLGAVEVEARAVPETLDHWQQEAVRWGEELGGAVHERFLLPLIALMRELDRDQEFVESAEAGSERGHDQRDDGRVLWVTRSLELIADEPHATSVAAHWTKDAIDGPFESMVGGGHLIQWLNYLFVHPAGSRCTLEERFEAQWTALRLAQYFYASLENIDTQLTRVLAHSLSREGGTTARQLAAQLQDCARRAEFISIHRRDVAKFVTRAVRRELDAILNYWDFEDAVEGPVTLKVAACERRLREIREDRAARATVFTDMILLGIGITSILATTLALTEFGRQMASDPDMAAFDGTRGNMTRWIAAQPADLLLTISVGISVLLAVVYVYFRRNHGR